jgi:hypothetical protein
MPQKAQQIDNKEAIHNKEAIKLNQTKNLINPHEQNAKQVQLLNIKDAHQASFLVYLGKKHEKELVAHATMLWCLLQ